MIKMKVIIRKAGKKDEEIFSELRLELTEFNLKNRSEKVGEDDKKERLERREEKTRELMERVLVDDNVLVLLAFLGENPAGYAVTYIIEETRGYIDEIFVLDKKRGRGIGKQFLNCAEEWFVKKGVKDIILNVFTWNQKAAEFYTREGFSEYFTCYKKDPGGNLLKGRD